MSRTPALQCPHCGGALIETILRATRRTKSGQILVARQHGLEAWPIPIYQHSPDCPLYRKYERAA